MENNKKVVKMLPNSKLTMEKQLKAIEAMADLLERSRAEKMKETLTKMEILGQNQKVRENLQKSKMRLAELKKTLPNE